jgi:HK97 family phage major capsid protein
MDEKVLAERSALMNEWDGLNKKAEAAEGLTADESTRVESIRSRVEAIDKAAEDAAKKTEAERLAMRTRAQVSHESFKNLNNRKTPQVFGIVKDYNDRTYLKNRDMALRGWFKGDEATDKHFEAAAEIGLNLRGPLDISCESSIDREIRTRAAQTVTTTGGGYAIPTGFIPKLDDTLLFYNPMRGYADVLVTDSGNTINMPTVSDTSNKAPLLAINTAGSETAITLGQVSLGAYKQSTQILVPNELIADSGINLEERLAYLLGERHGRQEQDDFTTADGSSKPTGIVTGATSGKTAASATAIAFNELIDLVASVDAAYQQNGVFMMHQLVWAYLCKLQDSYGRNYLIDPSNGNNRRLLGREVILNNAMASTVATGNKTVLFGDFKKFMIRQVRDRQLIRSTERYVLEDQTVFIMRQRYDSKVTQTTAIKYLVQA